MMSYVHFLGFIVSKKEYQWILTKSRPLEGPTPTTIHEVRFFMGWSHFIRLAGGVCKMHVNVKKNSTSRICNPNKIQFKMNASLPS